MAIFIRPFTRPCKRCDKIFRPDSRRWSLICKDCKKPKGNMYSKKIN